MDSNKTTKRGTERAENLIDLFTEVMNKKRVLANPHTASNYSSCIKKLHVYLGESAPSFRLHDVTHAWVNGWVGWLTELHPTHPETVDFYFRNTRAMYNLVLPRTMVLPAAEADPFRGVKIKVYRPSKRALSKREIRKLLDPRFREGLNPILQEAFDILRFIFFTNGMVFQDIYNLRWDMIDERGCIRFSRSKTGGYVETTIVPEAREIMERYLTSDSPFVFPFLRFGKKNANKVISEQNALRRINLHASTIGKQAQLSLPLTTYVMRHSWATLMLESGKAVELISQCMGHSNIQTTQTYLSRISRTKVENEVNDMLNLVREKGASSTSKKKSEMRVARPSYFTEIKLVIKVGKPKFEVHSLWLNKIRVLSKCIKKDFPFLCKKRKMPLLLYFNSVAKIGIIMVSNKFKRSYFYFLSFLFS